MRKEMAVFVKFSLAVAMCAVLGGCLTMEGSVKQPVMYAAPDQEAAWIRNGEPIEFEGELWYPRDGLDILLDSEMIRLGEYKGVEFFADKVDVRPFNQLYTKFGRNKFR